MARGERIRCPELRKKYSEALCEQQVESTGVGNNIRKQEGDHWAEAH